MTEQERLDFYVSDSVHILRSNGTTEHANAIAAAILELRELRESSAINLELVAQFMIQHSFATGHGDNIASLLGEFGWQISEHNKRFAAKDAELSRLKGLLEEIREDGACRVFCWKRARIGLEGKS